jgi:hypothetical protein
MTRAVWAALLLWLSAATTRAELVPLPACGPITRRHDHVEVIGKTLRGLRRTPLSHFGLVAFRGDTATPIPFQIDERRGRKVMVAGPELDQADHRPGEFDYDDGVVFMPCDAGDQPAPAVRDAYFEQVHATAWREIRIDDPLTGRQGYAYVVVAGPPPQAAARYVDYDPRDVVRTARYEIGMEQALPARFFLASLGRRNLLDGLRLRAEATWPANIARSTLTENDARHELQAWHAGPVRAVRRSGHDVHVALGIHVSAGVAYTYFYPLHIRGPGRLQLPISPGSVFRSVNAFAGVDMQGFEGWTYRGAGTTHAFAIDGQPNAEEAAFDGVGPWFLLTGEQEALLTVLRFSSNLSRALPLHLVYADDAARVRPPEHDPGSVPLVGYRVDAIETLPAGYYEFELAVFVLPDYRPGDERAVLDGFTTPLHVAVTAPTAPAAAPAPRP